MTDERHRDANWRITGDMTFEKATLAVLMDIRDELQRLNNLLHCSNFTMFPMLLRQIRRNTTKPSRKRKVKSDTSTR